MNKRAIILWSGGKDCHLALHKAKEAGYEIVALITFAPANAAFKAHPLDWMQWQAHALGLKHRLVTIAEPYASGYESSLARLKEEFTLTSVITGDISEVHGNGNWITERATTVGLDVFIPLWHMDRETALQQVVDLGYEVVLSCVKSPWFKARHLGRQLTNELIDELRLISTSTGLDLCGENGEYHTMVLDGPDYNKRISLTSFESTQEGDLWYLSQPQYALSEPRSRLERSKRCEQCGTGFSCYTEACWCAELPMIMPIGERMTGDCLCPECLKKQIDVRMENA